MGINIPQAIVAGVENAALSKGKMKHSALMAASVGLSGLVPAYTGSYTESTEKYLVEPIVAGILYAIGNSYIIAGEKNQGMMKSFVKGFVIGASSAGVTGALLSSQYGPVNSLYSPQGGLRGSTSYDEAKKETTVIPPKAPYANWTVV